MDERKECCRNEDNLQEEFTNRSDLILRRCKICKCRHFELTVDKGTLGLAGKEI